MKRLAVPLITLIVLSCSNGDAPFAASEITLQSIFGSRAKNQSTMYCLMGSGFFRAPQAEDLDAAIQEWISRHPGALAIPISTLESDGLGKSSDHNLTYVWIVDGDENLNLHLVRTGRCPAGVMASALNDVFVPKREYESFLRRAAEFEDEAKRSKIGIWGTAPDPAKK